MPPKAPFRPEKVSKVGKETKSTTPAGPQKMVLWGWPERRVPRQEGQPTRKSGVARSKITLSPGPPGTQPHLEAPDPARTPRLVSLAATLPLIRVVGINRYGRQGEPQSFLESRRHA